MEKVTSLELPLTRNEFLHKSILLTLFLIIFPNRAVEAMNRPEMIDINRFLQEVKKAILKLKEIPIQSQQFIQFCEEHKIENNDKNFEDYLIAKMNYEAFRYAGFLRFGYPTWTGEDGRTRYLNREANPNVGLEYLEKSAQEGGFRKNLKKTGKLAGYSSGECDTFAAFYAGFTQMMGVDSGLKWPTDTHTIAYSRIGGKNINVPTTHVWLGEEDSFGTKNWQITGGTVGPTDPRFDGDPVKKRVPKDFLDAYLKQLKIYGKASDSTLQLLRHCRNFILGGTVDFVHNFQYKPETTDDIQAIRYFLITEGKGLKEVNEEYYDRLIELSNSNELELSETPPYRTTTRYRSSSRTQVETQRNYIFRWLGSSDENLQRLQNAMHSYLTDQGYELPIQNYNGRLGPLTCRLFNKFARVSGISIHCNNEDDLVINNEIMNQICDLLNITIN